MRQYLRWAPCFANPSVFDCHECEIGAEARCTYRDDESMRRWAAQRWRYRLNLQHLEPELAHQISALCRKVLVRQCISMPAILLYPTLPQNIRSQLTPSQLESFLRSSVNVIENSPGMFRATQQNAEGSESDGVASLPDLSSGAALADLLHTNPPLSSHDQRAGFKSLAAIAYYFKLSGGQRLNYATAVTILVTEIDKLTIPTLQVEEWSVADAVRFASGPERVPHLTSAHRTRQEHRHQLLAAIGALELIERVKTTNLQNIQEDIRAQLLLRNVRLIGSIADRYAAGKFLHLTDIFQSGFEGLAKALEKYDVYMGFEFSTYATSWVRQFILRQLSNESRTIRLPAHISDSLSRIRRAQHNLHKTIGRPATLSELSHATGVATIQIKYLKNISGRQHSIPPLFTTIDETEQTITNLMVDNSAAIVQEVIGSVLTIPEGKVVRLRFGIRSSKANTLQEIGTILGLTRERVRQIEKKALEKLRTPAAYKLRELALTLF